MICTNHSNFCQTLFLSSLFHFTKSIILLVLFFYYEIKQMRNYAGDRIANPAPSERITRVSVRAISSFVDTSENNAKKIRRHDRRRFYREGGDWMYIALFTNHSKPTSIGPNHSHCLANYSNSVMIGYLGRKLPCKLLTIIYKEEPPPLTFLCSY